MQKKCKLKTAAAVFCGIILLIAGICVLMYPSVSDYYNRRHQTEVINSYAEQISAEDKTVLDSMWEQAQEYNAELKETGVPPENYFDILNVGGVMGYIEIPKISVYLPVYHTACEDVLQKGVGHIEASPVPVGGEGTHTLLTGHRGLPGAELFTRLDELEEGDMFYIHVLDRTLTYKITHTAVIKPYEFEALKPVCGKDLVTLITCTPYGLNSHRLLITGERACEEGATVEPEIKRPVSLVSGGVTSRRYFGLGALLGLGIFAAVLFVVIILASVRRYRKKLRSARHLKRKNRRNS